MRREVLSMTVIEYNSVQNSSFVDPGCSEMEVFGQADSRTVGHKARSPMPFVWTVTCGQTNGATC